MFLSVSWKLLLLALQNFLSGSVCFCFSIFFPLFVYEYFEILAALKVFSACSPPPIPFPPLLILAFSCVLTLAAAFATSVSCCRCFTLFGNILHLCLWLCHLFVILGTLSYFNIKYIFAACRNRPPVTGYHPG